MTDPIKALADAARGVLDHIDIDHQDSDNFVCEALHVRNGLRGSCNCSADEPRRARAALLNALASYDAAQAQPAPTDAEIEAAVNHLCYEQWDDGMCELHSPSAEESRKDLLSLIARMRGGTQA